MSVGRILTLGFGTFGGVNFLPTLGFGAGVPAPPPVATTQQGGGYYRKPKHWLQERREHEAIQQQEIDAILKAISPVEIEAKKLFRKSIKLPHYELPDIEGFIRRQEQLDRAMKLRREEDELMELLEII